MRVDLHLHTHISDGDLPPARLVEGAAAAGLSVIAVTDHDTAAGVPAAQLAARHLSLAVVPGIEVSTRWNEHEWHVLGYWVNPHAPDILEHQEHSVRRRVDRMERMIERLRGLGVPITFEEVAAAAGPQVESIGRPHLARALLAAGHIRSYGEAFLRYLADGGPAFVAQDFPSPEAAISTIHSAGGLAFWAHPPLDRVAEFLPRFVEWGVDGVECYRPSLGPEDVARLEGLAAAHGILRSGGSDWHGPHRTSLGDFHVRAEQVRPLLAHGGLEVPER